MILGSSTNWHKSPDAQSGNAGSIPAMALLKEYELGSNVRGAATRVADSLEGRSEVSKGPRAKCPVARLSSVQILVENDESTETEG